MSYDTTLFVCWLGSFVWRERVSQQLNIFTIIIHCNHLSMHVAWLGLKMFNFVLYRVGGMAELNSPQQPFLVICFSNQRRPVFDTLNAIRHQSLPSVNKANKWRIPFRRIVTSPTAALSPGPQLYRDLAFYNFNALGDQTAISKPRAPSIRSAALNAPAPRSPPSTSMSVTCLLLCHPGLGWGSGTVHGSDRGVQDRLENRSRDLHLYRDLEQARHFARLRSCLASSRKLLLLTWRIPQLTTRYIRVLKSVNPG